MRRANPFSASSGDSTPSGRNPEVEAFEKATVEFFVHAAGLLGVPNSVAAIYGIVFASPVPLSFADIESRLGISKGSVSQGLRVLREVGAVQEVSTREDRTELFTPDLELRKLVTRFLANRLQKQLDSGNSRLAGLKKSAAVYPPAAQKELLQRLKKLQQWHDRGRALLPVAKAFLKLGVGG